MPIKENLLAKIPFSLKLRLKKLLAKSGNRNESFAAAQKSGENQFQAIVFHDSLPQFDRDSGSLRLFEILKILARRGRVVFVPLYGKRDKFYENALAENGVETISVLDFDKIIEENNFDFTVLSRAETADKVFSIIKRVSPHTKIVFDTVDINYVRLEREYKITGEHKFQREADKFKKIEVRLARNSDSVWCVTEEDKNFLQNLALNAHFEIVPNIHAVGTRGKIFSERANLLFVGNYEHRPNVDAVVYFLDEIFPLILQKLPNVKFFVVGANLPVEIIERSSETIIVKGFVPEIEQFLENCRIMVAPLRYGAGMKGKIGQALAFGLPTVTTTIGAEGMNLTNEKEILIADNAVEFASEVVRVYQSAELWQRISDESYKYIKRNFSPSVVEEKISAALSLILE